MKYVYVLFLMLVFHTSCEQKQTEPHKDNINYNIKDTVTSYGPNSMVRNVKQDRNGNILFAASWGGAFRYDGKSFTNLTSKIGSGRYGSIWFGSMKGVHRYDGKTITLQSFINYHLSINIISVV
ncbi:hypothetical protein [Chitinophaga sp. 22620]|uniref:hypothetical protein n=1 Tax=Chitinophaga sp. 22620 TaxID=3453952 RepID=UPI003F839AEC